MFKKRIKKYTPQIPIAINQSEWKDIHDFIKVCFNNLPETIEDVEDSIDDEIDKESSDIEYGEREEE